MPFDWQKYYRKKRQGLRHGGVNSSGGGGNVSDMPSEPTPGFSLTAPVLTWVSGVTDNTPLFSGVFTDLQEGDVGRLQLSTDVGFSAPTEATNTADPAEVLALQLDYTSGALSDVQYWVRVRHERGASVSAWSNVETKTIDATAPTITSATTANNPENSTLALALTANETVTWTLNGGADVARFEISGSTLRWLSNGTKDYEAPNDAGTNNVYNVTVRATDTVGNTTDQNIAITVTDVPDTAVAPVVAASNTTAATNSGTPSVNLPASISAGDLLILEVAGVLNPAATTVATPSGWTLLGSTTQGFTRHAVFWKIASGSEGAAVTVTFTAAVRCSAGAYRITGHDAAQAPEIQFAANSKNPPTLTPSWGSNNNLWIAGVGGDSDGDTATPIFPTGYASNQIHNSLGNADGGRIAMATKAAIATSDDPSIYTIVGSSMIAFTIAVKPA